jgi:hypothetical protein
MINTKTQNFFLPNIKCAECSGIGYEHVQIQYCFQPASNCCGGCTEQVDCIVCEGQGTIDFNEFEYENHEELAKLVFEYDTAFHNKHSLESLLKNITGFQGHYEDDDFTEQIFKNTEIQIFDIDKKLSNLSHLISENIYNYKTSI